MEEYDVQIAINGDAFTPWHSLGALGYYPHSGDPVEPTGYAASKGTVYSEDTHSEPTLYIYKTNKASIESVIGKVYNAVSGSKWLIKNGEMVDDLGDSAQPRTAVALDRPGRRLIIVIVDGRQPGYSEGATLTEMAQLLLDNKGYTGFNLDGGGSTTLVMADENGDPQVINSPIHQGIPGNERPVANHLGIFAKEK
jgi:exopolysaccharide biosynthesis protein